MRLLRLMCLLPFLLLPVAPLEAQAPAPAAVPDSGPSPGASGRVLFSRDLNSQSSSKPNSPDPASSPDAILPGKPDPQQVTEDERTALVFTSRELDLHVAPAAGAISGKASVTVRNDGTAPLKRLILQLSSSLHWDRVSLNKPGVPLTRLSYVSRPVATDTDHTGWISEAVVTLPQPLAPSESIALVVDYSGDLPLSTERLERIGAPVADAAAADWDSVSAPDPESPTVTPVALRGFGNVLWYPISAPVVFLGDSARLFQLAGTLKLREQSASTGLRLALEFAGDPPDSVFFCGRTASFKIVYDNADAPAASGTGVATATFAAQPLGFRPMSLFVTGHPATATGTADLPDLIAAVTDNYDALKSYSAAAARVTPLLSSWLGKDPLTPMHLIDHPGAAFEDDALLVTPVTAHDSPSQKADLAGSLAHSLTHAWFRSAHPWIDEGLAQFMGLLWLEQSAGREAAIKSLEDTANTLALVEPAPSAQDSGPPDAVPQTGPVSSSAAQPATQPAGQPLTDASSEVFYRTKASAVWWMLRSYAGDDALREALQEYRRKPELDRDPDAMESLLERFSHQQLRWFFDDWVYNDRGLPDLTIVNVIPRQMEARNGSGAWLVSIEVRNDGDAVADVPVTIRSAPGASGVSAASETQRVRIPAHSSVSRRLVFPVTPSELQVNDGSVPEARVSVHTEHIGG